MSNLPWMTQRVTVSKTSVPITTPTIIDSAVGGDFLKVVFSTPDRDIQGIELRYTRGTPNSVGALPELTADNWRTAGERMDSVATINTDLPSIAMAGWEVTGRYRVFGRTINRFGDYSAVVEVGYHLLARTYSDSSSIQEAPLFSGTMSRLYMYRESTGLYLDLGYRRQFIEWNKAPWRSYGPRTWPTQTQKDARDPWYQTQNYDTGSLARREVNLELQVSSLTGGSVVYEAYFEHSTDNVSFTRVGPLTRYHAATFRYYRWRVYFTVMNRSKINNIISYIYVPS